MLILSLVLCASAAAASEQVIVVQTTANLNDALSVQPPQAFTARRARHSVVIRVDPTVRYQRITAAANTTSTASSRGDGSDLVFPGIGP